MSVNLSSAESCFVLLDNYGVGKLVMPEIFAGDMDKPLRLVRFLNRWKSDPPRTILDMPEIKKHPPISLLLAALGNHLELTTNEAMWAFICSFVNIPKPPKLIHVPIWASTNGLVASKPGQGFVAYRKASQRSVEIGLVLSENSIFVPSDDPEPRLRTWTKFSCIDVFKLFQNEKGDKAGNT